MLGKKAILLLKSTYKIEKALSPPFSRPWDFFFLAAAGLRISPPPNQPHVLPSQFLLAAQSWPFLKAIPLLRTRGSVQPFLPVFPADLAQESGLIDTCLSSSSTFPHSAARRLLFFFGCHRLSRLKDQVPIIFLSGFPDRLAVGFPCISPPWKCRLCRKKHPPPLPPPPSPVPHVDEVIYFANPLPFKCFFEERMDGDYFSPSLPRGPTRRI